MGTRCLTVFKEGNDEIAVMYRQFDGYPDGHGKQLVEWAAKRTLVNGFGDRSAPVWNGMGCLAANCVATFKTELGGFYLYSAGTRDVGEEYIYTISGPDRGAVDFGRDGIKPRLKVEACRYQAPSKVLYDGFLEDFDPSKCESEEE